MQQLSDESGLQLFSRFVFLDNRLEFFQKNVPEQKVSELLNRFRIDFAYLQLIAKKNQIDDPLDKSVVDSLKQIREHLLKYTIDKGVVGKDNHFGYGVIDVEKLILEGKEFIPIAPPKCSWWQKVKMWFMNWL